MFNVSALTRYKDIHIHIDTYIYTYIFLYFLLFLFVFFVNLKIISMYRMTLRFLNK